MNKLDIKTDDMATSSTPRCLIAMPFSQPWSDSVRRALESVMQAVRIDVFRVDTTRRTSLKLAKDVETQIRTSDIVVADVTDQNANVHVEIGLAIANDKDILLCAQTSDNICAHLRDYYFIKYATDKNGLTELSRTLRLRIDECIERARLQREKDELARQLQPEYEVKCYQDRRFAKLHEVFAGARNRIDILTTNLSWLFKPLADSEKSAWNHIETAVSSNQILQLRILTLNPESEIAAARGMQMGFSAGNFREQLRKALVAARAFETKMAINRVEIRTYDQLPTQITFRIDEEVYTCIVGQPMQSRYYPVLRFHVADPGVKEAFLSHFLAVWKDALPI